MSKTIPAELQAHYNETVNTTCLLLRVDKNTGANGAPESIGLACLDRDVVYDDGEVVLNYKAIGGWQPSSLFTGGDLSVDNAESEVLIPAYDLGPIVESEIVAGLYDDAPFRMYRINWSSPYEVVGGDGLGIIGDLSTAVVDKELIFQFLARGVQGTAQWQLVSAPSGASLSSDGVLRWTPSATGYANFEIKLIDSPSMAEVSGAWGVYVLATRASTNFVTGSIPTGYAGVPYMALANYNPDKSEGVYSVQVGYDPRVNSAGLPDGLTVGDRRTGTIVGVPTAAGDYSVTLTAAPFGNPSGTPLTDTLKVLATPSYTVFNPRDRVVPSNDVLFEDSDTAPLLTVHQTLSTSRGIARAVNALTLASSPAYWEVTIDTMPGASGLLGIGISAAERIDATAGPGLRQGEWAIRKWDDGISLQAYGFASSPGVSLVQGDVVRLAARPSGGVLRLWIAVNAGAWIGGGDPAADTSPTFDSMSVPGNSFWGDFRPAVWMSGIGKATANFGSSAWAYAAPSGFAGIPYSAPDNLLMSNVWETDLSSKRDDRNGDIFGSAFDNPLDFPTRMFVRDFYESSSPASVLAGAAKASGKWQFEVASTSGFAALTYAGVVPDGWDNVDEATLPRPGWDSSSFGFRFGSGTEPSGSGAGEIMSGNASVGTLTLSGAGVVITVCCDFDLGNVLIKRNGTTVGTYSLPSYTAPWRICGAGGQWADLVLTTKSLQYGEPGYADWSLG